MVGGYDYDHVAVQSRDAGQAAGRLVDQAATSTRRRSSNGFTEMTIVNDAPVSIKTAAGLWSPHNYKPEFLGPITLRTALSKSINTVSRPPRRGDGRRQGDRRHPQVRHHGADRAPPVDRARHAGGDAASSMSTATRRSRRWGWRCGRSSFTKIVDADGNVVEEPKQEAARKRRIPADTAYVMVDMMKNVVENGTGQKAKELGRPAGGKTGTSNDFKDNWFMAFTRDLVCGVWVGRDDFKTIGNDATGGTTAAPIWTEFMKAGHPQTPVRDFDPPPGVYFARATPEKGHPRQARHPRLDADPVQARHLALAVRKGRRQSPIQRPTLLGPGALLGFTGGGRKGAQRRNFTLAGARAAQHEL